MNARGERFLDEAETYVRKAILCAQRTMENRAWAIFDSNNDRLKWNLKLFERLNATLYRADSLQEVCRMAGLPYDNVKRNVDAYNDALKKGELANLNPACTVREGTVIGSKPPYYCVPFEGGMTATYGGPLIDVRARVQTMEGRAVPGLYAVGNASGGLLYHDYIAGAIDFCCLD